MRVKWQTLAGLLGVLALLAAGCGNAPEQAGDDAEPANVVEEEAEEPAEGDAMSELSGSIEIDGSSTVAPLTDAIAEEYAVEQPDVIVNVSVSGSGGGFERFCGVGDTDISNASRPIKQDEVDLCGENGIDFTEVRVGTDALTMVTNPGTDWVDCLTTEDIIQIWGPDGATTWDQVNPDFPAEPLQVFAPGTDSGTYDFFNETILEPSEIEEPRQDFNASEDDNIIAQGIIGTVGSWGYFGFAYFQESGDQLKALAYDAGEGCVSPSVETAQDDSYKLTRPLFIYVKNASLSKPEVADFVTYYLNNVNSLIDDVGYIAAPDETIAEAAAGVEAAIEAAG